MMNFRYRRIVAFAAAASSAVALSGCGGGGGIVDGESYCTVDGIECISRAEFVRRRNELAADLSNDDKWQEQPGLETVNAQEAHAGLAVVEGAEVRPGAGVTIAVMDSGVDLTHFEFEGADLTETHSQGIPSEVITDDSHGTKVTSVIAAQPDAGQFVGIAYGAKIKVYAVPIGQNFTDPYDTGNFNWAQEYRTVLAGGADIVNGSYSRPDSFIDSYETEQDLRNSLSDNLEDRVTAIAQADRDAGDRTIFVWSAGNDHGDECDPTEDDCSPDTTSSTGGRYLDTSPNLAGGAVGLLKELQGHNVVVVSVDENGVIADHSNRCGEHAANFCIAAPGVEITVAQSRGNPDPGPDPAHFVVRRSGTSYAAPMVTGGLALMMQFFREQLSNPELVTRLFATADKSGDYVNTSIYGQGLMDLGAAVTPLGPVRVTTGHDVLDGGHDIRATRVQLGSALGDGLSRSLAGREIAAFDTLGAPFWFDLSDFAGDASPSSVAARLHVLMAPVREGDGTRYSRARHRRVVERSGWRFGLHESPVRAESSLLNLAENSATLTVRMDTGLEATAFTSVDRGAEDTSEVGAVLAWRPSDEPFGMRLGWLGERRTVLGSTAEGAFGRLSAGSAVAGFELGTEFEGWRLSADIEMGLVASDAHSGIIAGLSDVTTSAISFRADRRLDNGDDITFSLSQPPRVERGEARLTVPVGRNKDGVVLHESFSAALTPSGREINLAARWQRTDVLGGELRAEVLFSHNPGHLDGETELGLLAGWRAEF